MQVRKKLTDTRRSPAGIMEVTPVAISVIIAGGCRLDEPDDLLLQLARNQIRAQQPVVRCAAGKSDGENRVGHKKHQQNLIQQD